MPLVSVIIVAHERTLTLKKAIDSTLQQTYKDIEIIVVANKISGEVRSILNNYQNINFFEIIELPEYVNANIARNKGIAESNGSLIAFLDDDDWWAESKIQKQVKLLAENLKIGLVYTGTRRIFDNKYYEDVLPDIKYSGLIGDNIFETGVTTTSTLLVRKSILKELGSFDEKLFYWQDYDLLIRMSNAYIVAFVPEILMYQSVNTKSRNRMSNNFEKWVIAVDYLYSVKHKKRIENLSNEINKKRLAFYNWDAVNRLDTQHRVFKRIPYFLKWIRYAKAWRWKKAWLFLILGRPIRNLFISKTHMIR
ncbi:glycosyltransferase [Leuconostoc mesenteroides]|uniref:glycosyltransferase family 2 protein n=1 Tax=Leuconostoc mesenteroides TaxID=1245 RepID=UPI0015F69A80|nr:glycosyltransferase [Leuconostoc mesenteroides]MBA5972289.1 glycosyltransferase [Leuconostoc mesenteroides]